GGVREGSSSKKLDHNAKEKVRRMKLNETFLALRSLLPDSRRAKKRWSGPYIIDRALDYVPQLQAEIEKLTLEKSNMLSVLGKKQQLVVGSSDVRDANKDKKTLTVSMNEVKSGEVIVQICEQNNKVGILSTLIEKLEGQGIHVLGASSQRACENRSCFHLHVQMGESPVEADYVAVLHKKIISWLS
uniref:BHLH domain-containing protein n=3 Tax=Chenopodium quinoa TaxID=63459 RepID=A0A803LF17_CHEQI